MQDDGPLEQAKTQMREAARQAMQTEVPRDLNRAWAGVATQFPEAFVADNHEALQVAFDSGLVV